MKIKMLLWTTFYASASSVCAGIAAGSGWVGASVFFGICAVVRPHLDK